MEEMNVGIAKRALHNDIHNGDQCDYWNFNGKTILCMVDGLGHGKFAEIAAKAAITYVSSNLNKTIQELFQECNKALINTRGVAMGIAIINEKNNNLQYAGVGNIRAKLISDKNRSLTCGYGIVGAGYKKLIVENHEIKSGDTLILYTDGLKEITGTPTYEDSIFNDDEKLATKILQDWSKGIDDCAVLVFRKK